MNQHLVIITGPTGVGKTDLALRIAHMIPSEIVNADVGQCYTPLTIGTAKPDWREHPVPHHLFDVYDEPRNFTVWEFREKLLAVVAGIFQRQRLPIIVGGSVFYIRSLFFPPEESAVAGDDIADAPDLWEQLSAVDPVRAQKIHKHDTYRIKRALAIWHRTGRAPSSFAPVYNPPHSFTCLIVMREREDLYARINERVGTMIERGWIEEVKGLVGTAWEGFLKRKKIIGYEVIIDYLKQGRGDWDGLIARVQQRTRNYAKRQIIFLRALERDLRAALAREGEAHSVDGDVETVNLTLADVDLYIKQLSEKITNLRAK